MIFEHMTWKINGEHLFSRGNHCSKISNCMYQAMEDLNIERTIFFQRPAVWLWPFTWTSIGSFTLKRHTQCHVFEIFQQKGPEIFSGPHYSYKDQHFDLDIWSRYLKINRVYLLSRGRCCTKFGKFQAKELKDIKKHYMFKDRQLTLTFDHVTWKPKRHPLYQV